ncbi:MAG: ATP-binding cassette domain-containing protein [Eubacteriales bacterium]|nr:ATP-binding cassette domain-containing protein [Eubacteriales bacterium]
MKGAPLIEIIKLSKVFSDAENRVVALNDISLTVHEKEIYGIVGMSGAGKSTLIRCINRLDTPNAGQVLYRGRDILAMDRRQLLSTRRKMGMIFQQFNLLMQRTVGQNVRYPLEIAGVKHAQANARVRELLDIVGLQDKLNAYPAQLSGGQRQRVAIARALASNPEVLLCDEATSALDPMTTQSILTLLQDINQRLGITIVLITHEMAVIRQICNRVAILDGGQVVEEGNVDEVFVHTQSEAGKRLFGILPEAPDEDPEQPALRIVFDGASAEKPIMANLIREHGILINILSANIRHLGGKSYGQMLIEMPAELEEKLTVVAYLESQGMTVKEVNNQ